MGPRARRVVLDPQGPFIQKWNNIFLISCIIALSLDPLFLYIPVIDGKQKCVKSDEKLLITACVLRTFIDILYILHIIIQFYTGFVAPFSRAFERGMLVEDRGAIAKRYISTYFIIDILSILPLSQLVVLDVTPMPMVQVLEYVVLAQYVPRLLRIYPISKEIMKSAPVYATTAWHGAAYSFTIYVLASHIIGAFWYLFSIQRQESCWQIEYEKFGRDVSNLYCARRKQDFAPLTFLNGSCPLLGPDEIKDPTVFNFGMFIEALQSQVVETSSWLKKLLYCFWWGFHNVGSLGQNLNTSPYAGEILFAAFISTFGLIFVSSFIGIMIQNYLQSTTFRREETRTKMQETELWMSRNNLTPDLRYRVRQYQQYKWLETKGVEEENLIRDLPTDLRRDIKRHLCLSLLMRVPIFGKMDDQLLNALCDRLKTVFFTKDSYIVREGDQVNEMIFIMKGKIEAVTTNGGTSGFFNSVDINAGDFCGEDLLACVLDPRSPTNFPISTRSLRALSEVEAFALMADDLKSVSSLILQQLGLTLRYVSVQWRTWAACFIQAAWRQHCQRKLHKSLVTAEDRLLQVTSQSMRTRSLHRSSLVRVPPQKPSDPDFTTKYAKKNVSSTIDTVMEELKSLKVGMEAIAAAGDCVCGNPRKYSEVQLYEEMEKVEGISDEMRMRVYQALCQDPSAARGFLACPAQEKRALWVKVKFGASML